MTDGLPPVGGIGEPWYTIEMIRAPGFAYGDLPQALFDRIREQMAYWDDRRHEWVRGTKNGEPKCASQFANHNGSEISYGHACVDCVAASRACLALRKGVVQIRALPVEDGNQATKSSMAYWIYGSHNAEVDS